VKKTALRFFLGSPVRLVLTGIVVLLFVIPITCNNTIDRFNCTRQWSASGMRHRFDWWGGCLIETSPGRWIPARNYREVP
jgi:hypothetical protein